MKQFEKWHKIGQLYCPPTIGRHPKLISHAANPLAVHIEGDVYRVFFSGRDANNRSSVGAVDIDLIQRTVIKDHYQPFFQHGLEGSFYSDGVSIGNCYEADGVNYMLFMGWQVNKENHWRGDIGRLVLKSDLTLSLDSQVPLMGSNAMDPVSLSYPWVLRNDKGNYDMWYGSTKTWDTGNGEMLHVINYASSLNGHTWHRKGLAVPYEPNRAQAFSRPAVTRDCAGRFRMWFSYRSGMGQKYRIGHAFSNDGRRWELALDGSGIDVSTKGWDSEMIAYPFVFDHKNRSYMLYNGNGYGKSGIGLAVLSHG